MTALAIAMIFFIAALVVFAIDLMIPTGGVLIAVTGLLACVAIYFAFKHSPTSGWWMLIASLALIPLMLMVLIYIWPKTPFGRRIIATPSRVESFAWSDSAGVSDPKKLIGAFGTSDTEFLPHGMVKIGEQVYEAVSEAGPIEPGTPVRVTKLDVGRLVVVPWQHRNESNSPMSASSNLDRSSQELGLDSLD